MTELSRAIALSGALDEEMMREFAKWRLPIEVPDEEAEPLASPEAVVAAIEEAQQSHDFVEVRMTELDAKRLYTETRQKAKIHLEAPNASGTFDISCGITPNDEYLIPWQADSIVDVLTNGESYLIDGRKKVYFSRVVELYFGGTKAFMLCTPIREPHGKASHKS